MGRPVPQNAVADMNALRSDKSHEVRLEVTQGMGQPLDLLFQAPFTLLRLS